MLLSHHQNVGRNPHIKKVFGTLENALQFKYFGTAVPNQESIQEEIKRRLNLGNACYHAVQNLSFSHLLSKNIKIKV
jgi:hypothetical protein